MSIQQHFLRSGSAGAALAEIGSAVVEGLATWITVKVKTTGAALTNFAFDVCFNKTDFDAGTWLTQLSSTDWADAAKFQNGEESGYDDAGNSHTVNALGDGETVVLRLLLTGFYAIRFRALGSGATVTIEGPIQ